MGLVMMVEEVDGGLGDGEKNRHFHVGQRRGYRTYDPYHGLPRCFSIIFKSNNRSNGDISRPSNADHSGRSDC